MFVEVSLKVGRCIDLFIKEKFFNVLERFRVFTPVSGNCGGKDMSLYNLLVL